MHNKNLKTTGMNFITRSTKRNMLKAGFAELRKNDVPDNTLNRAERRKHQREKMRKAWTDMQIKKHGRETYIAMRYATDPKGRHSLAAVIG